MAQITGTTTQPSTPLFIQSVPVDDSVRTVMKGQPLLVQPVSTIRAARLDAEAAAEGAGWFKDKSFPAGTLMFGAYAGSDWSYCAVAESRQSWWSGDQFICYIDQDGDGRFDAATDSGSPFNGVALLVFGHGATRPLAIPAPYSRIDPKDGPTLDYAIGLEVVRPRMTAAQRQEHPETRIMPATHIRPTVGFIMADGRIAPLSSGSAPVTALVDHQTATIDVLGARIEILGVYQDDSIRYRVIRPMPAHIDQITMRMTTSTYVYVVSY